MIKERIARLREAMKAKGLHAYVVFSSDPHISEYLPQHWEGRSWLSGFDGSAGTLVVTRDQAALWADSRYWVQAEHQLQGSDIQLMRLGKAETPALSQWLCDQLQSGDVVGVDGRSTSIGASLNLRAALEPAGMQLNTQYDLLDTVWTDRPALPQGRCYPHDEALAGGSLVQKVQRIREELAEQGVQNHLICSLDDIAYITNYRGTDVDYNPVFLAYLLITPERCQLFVDERKFDAAQQEALRRDGVELAPYAQVFEALRALPAGQIMLLDPARTNTAALEACAAQTVVEDLNPSQRHKSCKTEVQVQCIRNAMDRDGAALVRFFNLFEKKMAAGERLTEVDVDTLLTAERAKDETFISLSFGTIAGFNANGAMPHYSATPENHAVIEGDGLLLIDSGAQYPEGTTDITRVVPIGTPSEAQKADFTLVLQSHINLALAHFPVNFPSPLLDIHARAPLWEAGVDFGHGTGHGVGFFLNVHEGPQSISWHGYRRDNTEMKLGMITSNEPGLYREGQWGIRIESLIVNVPAAKTEFGEYLKFETVTMCPIDTRLVLVEMLSERQRAWLNDYHAEVRKRLSPRLSGDDLRWLIERTEAI